MAKKATKERGVGSAFDLLGKSWAIVKKNWQAFVVVNILSILIAFGDAFAKTDNTQNDWLTGTGGDLAGIAAIGAGLILLIVVVAIFLFTMATSLEVKSTDGKKPGLGELFNDGTKYFFRLIGLGILSGLTVIVGLLLLVVPGIIAIGRLIMSPYHLVDKDLGVIEAMKQSNSQAIGNMGKVYGAIGVSIVVTILAGIVGMVPVLGPLVGAVIGIGFSLVLALRYQQLKKV